MANAIVVGLGIGGLTAATALRRSGYQVTILEKVAENRDVGAGIQLAPNATRVLAQLDLLDAVRDVAVQPERRTIRRWNDASIIHQKGLGSQVEQDFGSPFLVVHRADLLRVLLERAADPEGAGEPVRLVMGRVAKEFRTEGDQAVVRTADGEEWRADVVIGADGVHSVARRCIGEPDVSTFSGESVWLGNIPAERVKPSLREIAGLEVPTVSVWLGPGRHAVHYPVRREGIVTFGVTMPASESEESYTAQGRVEDMLDGLSGWDPRLLDLLSLADSATFTPLRVRQPLTRWSSGRVVLVGDACHPMLPYQAQGAAQSMEDASVLGSMLKTGASIEQSLLDFELARRARATAVQVASSHNATHYHVEDPEGQAKRDVRLVERGGNASLDWEWLWRGRPSEQPPTPLTQSV